MPTQVAILGGGLAGLYAAHLLHTAGVPFQLFESRNRLGGRILTADASGRPSQDGFDLGPSWTWPAMQPAIAAVIEELGISTFPQNSDGDVIFERMSREAPQRYRGLPQPAQSMRLAGGTAALITALARTLPAESLHLESQVTHLALRENTVTLTIRKPDGTSQSLTSSQIIAAMPPRLLQAAISFVPLIDESDAQLWRRTPTWMAPHAKFFALYEQPFWRRAGLSGTAQSMVGPLAEVHDATTASGAAALFGFLGVGADHRQSLGKAALAQACIDQLTRLFGPQARSPHATLFKDWSIDPHTATVDDTIATGHLQPFRGPWVTGPWQTHLFLGGSETSPTEPGYLAGAIDAAQRAVAEILHRLRSTPK